MTLLDDVNRLISKQIGDVSRLQHIKNTIENNKTLYQSDRQYLDDLLVKFSDSSYDESETTNFQPEENPSESVTSPEDLSAKLKNAEEKIEQLEKKSKENDVHQYRQNYYKSEGTTLVLSLVLGLLGLNGIGHIYVGKVGKGIGILIGSIILFISGIVTVSFGVGIFLLVIYFVVFIWQIIDSRKLCFYYNGFIEKSGKAPW